MSELPPIIFLDIDGVLNSERTLLVYPDRGRGYQYLDPVAIGLINTLCEDTESKIVISSTWRKNYREISLADTLSVAGFNKNHFFLSNYGFYTPSGRYHSRGDEITAWLEDYGYPKHFCCIDDRTDFREDHHLVWCNPEVGFSVENYYQAKEWLTGDKPRRKIFLF